MRSRPRRRSSRRSRTRTRAGSSTATSSPRTCCVAEGEELSIRLLDFGLAQLAEEESLTATGDVPGTLAYVPPERLRGESGGPPADIWAVGALLWESLAGWHPFWNGSLLETAQRIESGAAPLAQVRPDLPKQLTTLVDRMLALDPAARPPAARLALDVRDAFAERLRRRKTNTTLPPISLALPVRLAAPAAAGIFAGWTAAALPFYPPLVAPHPRAARLRAHVHPAPARTRVCVGGAGPPARERLLRARARVRGPRLRLARAFLARSAGGPFPRARPAARPRAGAGPIAAGRAERAQPPSPSHAGRGRSPARRGRCGFPPRTVALHRSRSAQGARDHGQRGPVRGRRGALARPRSHIRRCCWRRSRSPRPPSCSPSRESAASGRLPASAPG